MDMIKYGRRSSRSGNKQDMKEKLECTIAVIFVILLAIFLVMVPIVRSGSAMDQVEQQIHDESMIT